MDRKAGDLPKLLSGTGTQHPNQILIGILHPQTDNAGVVRNKSLVTFIDRHCKGTPLIVDVNRLTRPALNKWQVFGVMAPEINDSPVRETAPARTDVFCQPLAFLPGKARRADKKPLVPAYITAEDDAVVSLPEKIHNA